MVDFTVDVSKLSGFTLDLQDIGANFTENAGRLLPGLALPAGTAGQLAQLSVSIQKLQTTLSGDHQKDTSALGTLGSGLGTAATAYKNSDEQHAVSINQAAASLTDGQGVAATSQAGDVRRFTGLQQPSLQNVEEAQYTVRQVVTGCVGLLTSYDEPLGRTIGIKPVADYLAPVEADWEALQGVGKRIGLLGINDFAHSQNLSAGTGWIQADWTGAAATAFGATATTLGQSNDHDPADLRRFGLRVRPGHPGLQRERIRTPGEGDCRPGCHSVRIRRQRVVRTRCLRLTRLLRSGQSGANPLISKEITTAATAAAPRTNVTVDASAKTRMRRHQDNPNPAAIATSAGIIHVIQYHGEIGSVSPRYFLGVAVGSGTSKTFCSSTTKGK
ncbi:hypothetical protein ACWFRF_32780 [Nocardia sp. NPDC055165]